MDEKKTQINAKNLTRFKFQKISILGILALLSFVIIPVYAADPFDQFTFQGVLKDSGDNLVTATKDVTLEIFTTLTGGTALWSETHDNISVSKGIFTVVAGSVTPFSSFLNFTDAYFLQVKIADSSGANQETLSPRIKITAAPYSLAASRASVDFDLNKKNLINATSLNSTALEISQTGTSLAANITNTGTGDSFRVNDQPSDTSPFLIDSTGKVGIGDTTPDNLLDILSALGEAAIAITSTGTDTDAIINFELTDGTPTFVMGIDDSDLDKFKIGTSAIDTNTRVTIDSTGNVGIGTTSPVVGVQLVRNDNAAIRSEATLVDSDAMFQTINDANPWSFGITGVNDNFNIANAFDLATNVRISITTGGNVGIGTTSVTKAKLQVEGSQLFDSGAFAFYTVSGGAVSTGVSSDAVDVSIRASNRIVATEFDAFSDARTKNIQQVSTSADDLEKLMGIEITDFTFKDVAQKGNKPHKKVIGQQVAQVYDQAVSLITDFVPDIYALTDTLVYDEASNLLTIIMEDNHNLSKGDKVRMVFNDNQGFIEREVIEVVNEHAFIVGDIEKSQEEVFVYGKEVDDFVIVDYDALATLDISATQELAKRQYKILEVIQEQQSQIEQLQAEIDELKSLVCLDHPSAMVCRR